MRVVKRLAVALAGASMLAGPTLAGAEAPSAPAIKRSVAVHASPVNPVPDAGEGDQGLEAREAMSTAGSPGEVQQVMAGSLNAQFATLQPAAAPGGVAPPAVASVLPAAAPAPVATLVPATAPAPIVPAVMTVAQAAAPEPAATPTGPSVALARRVVESAEAFADYMGRASALKADFADAGGVTRAVAAGGVYEPGQLEEGAISYVTLVALQDPEFVRSVDAVGRQADHALLAQALLTDPRAVMRLPSSADAAARAAKALGAMGSALQSSGAAIKQSAYDIQHSPWSKAPVATPAAMLAELKARSGVREVMAADSGEAMLGTLSQLRTGDAGGGSGRLTPVVAQGLTLAALAVLGEAGEEHADRVASLLNDQTSAQCLKMARLNLYQCLSVAGPNYEDVFCLGQHAMMDTARCVADASGWSAPEHGIAVPVARPEAPHSIMVPVAMSVPVEAAAPPAAATAPEPVSMEMTAAAPAGDPTDATPEGAPPPIGFGYAAPAGDPGER